MSAPGPRITITFGYGGTKPKVTHKLGSVSLDQAGTIGTDTFRGPLPAGRKSLFFRNGYTSPVQLSLYAPGGVTSIRTITVLAGKSVLIPVGNDVGHVYTGGNGPGRMLVLQ
jgi:hypothetical protein